MNLRLLFLTGALGAVAQAGAQDGLDSLLAAGKKPETVYTTATFKGTRVINLQSVEKAAPGTLQLLIQHRFGAVDGGGYEFFGLDQATMRLGLEYGVHRAFVVGIGRSTLEKNWDAYTKVTLLRQSTGATRMPLSAAYFGSVVYRSQHDIDPTQKNGSGYRYSYCHQLLLARKFSERFSLELAPTWIHKNQVDFISDANNIFAVGAGARVKLTRRTSFNLEYIARIPPANTASPAWKNNYNSLSVGFDIETGGHVFQLHLTNSLSMVEKGFITESSESWGNGGIHLGFNISRDFVLKGKKKKSW
ncbi:hypothetical protein EPD60_04800 [Flaviaesturariibacter flavus]|uniref:DUF5777 domain-containing protein n=1 Tax=Flaviaesturariibacter flavus TaxID=2502780 RepID=A0A4R1BJK4_9BACT|nr:DUF5777 family beta-barrel protein [Flaviaesturariibacter flavus]TCJ17513.1 hypothetical protein EPD60_04800 [Flaviaesturariibacter flavus]